MLDILRIRLWQADAPNIKLKNTSKIEIFAVSSKRLFLQEEL